MTNILQRSIVTKEFLLLAQASLAAGAELRFRARGYSMRPHIFDGDLLALQPLRGELPQVNEIVLAHTGEGRSCVHRVAAIKGERLLLRADSAAMQGWVRQDEILGRVQLLEKNTHLKRLIVQLLRTLNVIISLFRQKQA